MALSWSQRKEKASGWGVPLAAPQGWDRSLRGGGAVVSEGGDHSGHTCPELSLGARTDVSPSGDVLCGDTRAKAKPSWTTCTFISGGAGESKSR